MFTIFIDESGTLPDKKDKVVIVAAVGTQMPSKIDKIFKSLHKTKNLKKKTGELKFYTAGDKTKTRFFEKVAKETKDEAEYYYKIKSNIINEIRLNWNEAKRLFLKQKLV